MYGTHVRAWVTVAAACGLSLTASRAAAQARYEFPGGTVEVLGLRRWTLSMLRDSAAKYAPGQALHEAACMVMLREQLHFAEASVTTFQMARPGEPRRTFKSITLVEPEDSARVVWDPSTRSTFSSLLPDYAALILPVTDSLGGVSRARLLSGLALYRADAPTRGRRLGSAPAMVRQDAERLWAFLAQRQAESDRQRAMKVIQTDGFFVNRLVALGVLTNFAAHDSTWWTLARALRDPHEAPRGFAAAVLRDLPRRRIDWSPATVDLRHLLAGTNLVSMPDVFDLLVETHVDPALASSLLRDNAEWVLDYLGSEAPGASAAAHRLLVQLNRGVDLGTARSRWATWISTL